MPKKLLFFFPPFVDSFNHAIDQSFDRSFIRKALLNRHISLYPTQKASRAFFLWEDVCRWDGSFIVVVRHFQSDSFVAAFDVKAFVRFGAVEDCLRRESEDGEIRLLLVKSVMDCWMEGREEGWRKM